MLGPPLIPSRSLHAKTRGSQLLPRLTALSASSTALPASSSTMLPVAEWKAIPATARGCWRLRPPGCLKMPLWFLFPGSLASYALGCHSSNNTSYILSTYVHTCHNSYMLLLRRSASFYGDVQCPPLEALPMVSVMHPFRLLTCCSCS